MFNKTRLRFSNREYTIGGVVASTLALLSIAVLIYSVHLSFAARGRGSEMIGILGLISMVLSLFGLIFGILSYKEQDKRYGMSFFGTFVNGILLVLLVFFILTGM